MRKIGLLCLALVVALGGLGIGYAAWTDEVTISGTVNTGSLDIEVVNQSNTWVWKDMVTEAAITMHQFEYDPLNSVAPNYDCVLIAYADADCPVYGQTADDTVVLTFSNIFPDIEFVGDFLIHYNGSIPAKVSLGDITCSNTALQPYFHFAFFEATWNPDTPAVDPVKGDEIEEDAIQMHFCDYVLVEVTLEIPEDAALMSQSGTISGVINAIQWNEYVAP